MPIEDTSQRDPMTHLLGMMGGRDATYITDMEADGQKQLLASSQLPKNGPWDELIKFGFTRGSDVDDLFVNATLPDGWTREGSKHAMHSYLLDERGIRRVNVFYKAAFYDRKADMHLLNAGYAASTEVLYGDDPVKLPEKWDLFNDEEKAAFRSGLDQMRADIERSPRIYGDRADRLAQADALLAGTA